MIIIIAFRPERKRERESFDSFDGPGTPPNFSRTILGLMRIFPFLYFFLFQLSLLSYLCSNAPVCPADVRHTEKIKIKKNRGGEGK